RCGRHRSGGNRVQCGLEIVERGDAFRRRDVTLVGEVVGHAREPVDGEDRGTQRLRNEQRRDGKVFVMTGGHDKSGAMRRNLYISPEDVTTDRRISPGERAPVRLYCSVWRKELRKWRNW